METITKENKAEVSNNPIQLVKRGRIKFVKPQEPWGKISDDESRGDYYFNFENLKDEIRSLITSNRYADVKVEYEVADSSRKPGEKQAVNLRIDRSEFHVGHICDFDGDSGAGHIEDFDSKKKISFHIGGLKKTFGKEDKFVRVEIDNPVVFKVTNRDGKFATDTIIIESRYPIERFAVFQDFSVSLKILSSMAEDEKGWDYLNKPTKRFPILFSYINQSFKRLLQQEKIKYGKSKDGKEYAYFNTGLVTPQQEEIFAYFAKNQFYRELDGWGIEIPRWFFLEFNTEEQSNFRRYFSENTDIATYFEESEVGELIFDMSLNSGRIILVKDHLLKRKSRFESERIKNLDDEAYIEKLEQAVELAKKRIRRNYKTAIPHYYSGKIQFLLPLCINSKKDADAALVVNKEDNIYKAHTILNLDQAFNNARLLAKPDREWLNP